MRCSIHQQNEGSWKIISNVQLGFSASYSHCIASIWVRHLGQPSQTRGSRDIYCCDHIFVGIGAAIVGGADGGDGGEERIARAG